MKTIENLHKISLIFFLILGSIHLASSLLIANGNLIKPATLINRTFDIPVILTGACYAFTSLKINLNQNKTFQRILDLLLIILSLLLFLILIYVNFFLQDI